MAFKRNRIIKTLKNLINELNQQKIPINQAYLFGSYAKGKPNAWSDIDVALVSPKFKGTRFYDVKMLLPHLKNFSNFIEVHPFNQTDFNPRNLFVKEIIEKGIKI